MTIVREALVSLARHRGRAALSMLGIAWGIVSVVVLLAYGEGFNQALLRGFQGAFGDGVTIMFGGQTSMQAGGERAGRRVQMRLADVEAASALPFVKAWSPEYWQDNPVSWRTKQGTFLIRGVAPAYGSIRNQPAAAGRFIDGDDVRLRRRVAFLGSEVARDLFGQVPAVGQRIRIRGMVFDVVGVQREKVQLSNYTRQDKDCVFIPHTTAGQIWNTEYLNAFVFQAVDASLHEKVNADVTAVLARRLRFNPADERALRTFGSLEALEITGSIVLGLKLVMTFIGVLTLAIGGVGVMNVMFVTVTERTREIGLRKALGARKTKILIQFLLEGLAVTFTGGALGVIMSYVLVWLISPRPFLSELLDDPSGTADIHMVLSLQLLGICTAILIVVGIVSSLLPAIRAARLDPIDALRYE